MSFEFYLYVKTRLIYCIQVLRQLNFFMIPDDARAILLIYLEQWKEGGGWNS